VNGVSVRLNKEVILHRSRTQKTSPCLMLIINFLY